MKTKILERLACQPSRSSAATIGHEFVLSEAPPQVQMRGIEALTRMVCDWSIAILEEAINDPSQNCLVRQYAIRRLGALLNQATAAG